MSIGRVIDVSSAQHPGGKPIDWAQVKGAGVTTVIIKATEGTGYTNPWFHQDLAGARGAGLDVMAYHFASFGTVSAELAHFLAVAGDWAQCLDIETSENVPWSRTFLQGLGKPAGELLVYGSASSLRSVYAQLPALPWVAAYQAHSPGWGVLWQFTSSGQIPGIPAAVDLSNWQGSEIQYETLFRTDAPPIGEFEMLAPTPSGNGFWECSAGGAIVTYGDAQYLGGPNTSNTAGAGKPPVWNGPPNLIPGHTIVQIVAHPVSQGYWCIDNVGNRYAYGAAPDFASPN